MNVHDTDRWMVSWPECSPVLVGIGTRRASIRSGTFTDGPGRKARHAATNPLSPACLQRRLIDESYVRRRRRRRLETDRCRDIESKISDIPRPVRAGIDCRKLTTRARVECRGIHLLLLLLRSAPPAGRTRTWQRQRSELLWLSSEYLPNVVVK